MRVFTQQGFKQIKGRTSRGLLGEGAAIGSCSAPPAGHAGWDWPGSFHCIVTRTPLPFRDRAPINNTCNYLVLRFSVFVQKHQMLS